jgi:hypothetical protein
MPMSDAANKPAVSDRPVGECSRTMSAVGYSVNVASIEPPRRKNMMCLARQADPGQLRNRLVPLKPGYNFASEPHPGKCAR